MLLEPHLFQFVNQRKPGFTEVYIKNQSKPIIVAESPNTIIEQLESFKKNNVIKIMSFGLEFTTYVEDNVTYYGFYDGTTALGDSDDFGEACSLAIKHIDSCL